MLLEIFEPYMVFISFFITIIVNIYLIIKKVDWIILIVGNLLVAIVMGFFGLSEYNIITVIVDEFVELVGDFITSILF